MRKRCFLLALLLLIFAQSLSAKKAYSVAVQKVVAIIINDDYFENKAGCRYENSSLSRVDTLASIASNKELIKLTDHTSPIVRCYAFQALAEKSHPKALHILLKHLYDSAYVKNVINCNWNNRYLAGDIFYEIMHPYGKITPKGKKLNAAELEIIDSFFIYNSNIPLESKVSVLYAMEPKQKYYSVIRDLVINHNRAIVLPLLAKYHKKQDIEVIKKHLDNEEPYFSYNGMRAVVQYPLPEFEAAAIALFKKEMAKRGNEDGTGWEKYELIPIFLQYNSRISKKLFEDLLADTANSEHEGYRVSLKQALREYPVPAIDSLFPKFDLRPDIQSVVDTIERHTGYDDMMIGIDGMTSPQWQRSVYLEEHATAYELEQLVYHPSPAVRCNSFRAMAAQSSPQTAFTFIRLANDFKGLSYMVGCTGDWRSVSSICHQVFSEHPESQIFDLRVLYKGKEHRLKMELDLASDGPYNIKTIINGEAMSFFKDETGRYVSSASISDKNKELVIATAQALTSILK